MLALRPKPQPKASELSRFDYLKMQSERYAEQDRIRQELASGRQQFEHWLQEREQKRFNSMPFSVVAFYYQEGRITKEDWEKYIMSYDGDFVPPIKGINC